MRIKISSRKSDLARIQAYQVGNEIKKHYPHTEIIYYFRASLGDQNQDDPLWKMPTKGVFTEDFKSDLLTEETDLVVHSWKDLPTELGHDTLITCTLPRADSRDLILFKKSSVGKSQINFLSSSPRRSWNIKPLLLNLMPFKIENIEFSTVRGNVQTRIRKLLENQNADGLIVAKAALDRLLSVTKDEFQETQEFIKNALLKLNIMVLPLSENPTAAAQGALAIEVKKTRTDLIRFLKPLNCEKTFQEATRERLLLSEYGGGCHLALGMSVKIFEHFEIVHVKGNSPSNELVEKHELLVSSKSSPPQFSAQESWSSSELTKTRSPLNEIQLESGAWIVSRIESLPQNRNLNDQHYWAAGLETWKKLAEKGIWVLGCHDSLGGGKNVPLQFIYPELKWKILTHTSHPNFDSQLHKATYSMKLSGRPPEHVKNYFWKSASDFEYVSALGIDLKNAYHACGPGSTYSFLKAKIQENQLNLFSNEDNWRKSWQK